MLDELWKLVPLDETAAIAIELLPPSWCGCGAVKGIQIDRQDRLEGFNHLRVRQLPITVKVDGAKPAVGVRADVWNLLDGVDGSP